MKTPTPNSFGHLRGGSSFTPKQVEAHVRAFAHSGLSMSAYARKHRLRFWTLRWWLEKAGRLSSRGRPRPTAFQTVPLSSVMGPAWAAEVVSATGVTVRLSGQVPPALATQLIELTTERP